MMRRHESLFVRICFAALAVALLSAFSYPLVREGYERAGSTLYQNAQKDLLRQAISEYLQLKRNPGWTVSTSTRQILNDLCVGVDRDFDGKKESLLPPSVSVEALFHSYRIIYKNPQNFKVLAL